MNRNAGFSAIEALVAVAIVALALIPLLDLQRQVLIAHERQLTMHREAAATEDALVLLRDLNPDLQPTGALPRDGGAVSWTSRSLTDSEEAKRPDANDATYSVRRFQVEVRVTSADGEQLSAFSVEKLGWRRLNDPNRVAVE